MISKIKKLTKNYILQNIHTNLEKNIHWLIILTHTHTDTQVYLNDSRMVSKIKKTKPTMNPMKSNPPTKTNPFTNIIFRQITTKPSSTDPQKTIINGLFRNWD